MALANKSLERVLMVYGTTYCGRENCYIGKLKLEINYNALKEFINPGAG
jgi:hypothetical protein